jgi:Predicted transcriptional regulators
MHDLGNKLKELRLSKKLTQVEVAEKLDVSKSRISSYELNINEPDLKTLVELVTIYNTSIDSLLGFGNHSYLDVTGLTQKQISALQSIIDSYREP